MTTASADPTDPDLGGPNPGSASPGEVPNDSLEWVSARPPRLLDFLQRVVGFPRLVVAQRDLIQSSVKRELESRFKGTLLGWLWPLVHPLFLFVVYYFIFTNLLSFKIGSNIPAGQESALGIYMFVGILVFAAMAESMTRAATSILDNGNLIKKLAFPSEILPLNVTLVGLVTLVFGVGVFILMSIATPIWTVPSWHLLWIPACLVVQAIFTYGLGLLLATLQVFLRDTAQLVGVLVTAWMFSTPLFWVPELIEGTPEAPATIDRWMPLIKANPMYHCVQAWRGALMGDLHVYTDSTLSVVVSSPVSVDAVGGHLLTFLPWAIGSYLLGYALFVFSQRRFADEV